MTVDGHRSPRTRTQDEETLPHLTLGAHLSRSVLERPSAGDDRYGVRVRFPAAIHGFDVAP
jgi:hypothetical protein